MRPVLQVGVIAMVAVLGSCGGEKADGSAAAGSDAGIVRVPTSGGTATTIHLVVGGGPHAGTYDAKSNDITCTYGFAGPGSWGNQYSVTGKKPNEFSSLQLIVPNTKDAADGTDKFLITAGFGQLMQPGYTEHTINTGAALFGGNTEDVKKEGSGTITVDDRGKSGKVTFKGKTKDNVSLEGTIDCHQVMRGES
jgi:hypothetical protein